MDNAKLLDKKSRTVSVSTRMRWINVSSVSLILLIGLLCGLESTNAYEILTHMKITEKAINQSKNYQSFKSVFGIYGNYSIIEGSKEEDNSFDIPPVRARHHFYDPTNGNGLVSPLCSFFLGGCIPSLTWGYDHPNNDFSWTKAREEMYIGLTGKNFNEVAVAPTEEQRKEYSQKMFRSVGQVMHLVQDLAQPAHVRNDAHPPIGLYLAGDLYEKYTLEKYRDSWTTDYPTVNLSQFSSYWNAPQGLAFFTNKNFISQDTNFDNFDQSGHLYYNEPLPAGFVTKTETIQDQFGNNIQVQVDYVRNVIQDPFTGDTINNDQLSAFSVFDFEAQEFIGRRVYSVNDNTMESAANILVRRAVGYSAGLLDYFFRGNLRMIPVPGGGIRFQNVNTETMSYYIDPTTGNWIGRISVYYDNASGRQFLTSYDLPGPLAQNELTPVISFSPPTDNIKPGKYIVVFRGKLGEEEGAIVVASSPKIYYVSTRMDQSNVYRDKIYRVEMDGSNPILVHDNQDPNVTLGFLAPSPDGLKLAFVASSATPSLNPTIYIRDLVTGTVTPFTDGESPSWSPDGTKIVFHRETGQSLPFANHEIFEREVASGAETQLTFRTDPMGGGFNNGPAWSPDGNKIAIYKFRVTADPLTENCGNSQIVYLINTLGNWLEPLSCTTVSLGQTVDKVPSWSGRGNEIVFQRRFPGKNFYETYKVDVATKVQTKLTDSNGMNFNELNPVLSPDGQVIAVGSERDGDFDIWLVDANGGGYLTNLTNASNTGVDGWPAFGWAP